MSCIEEPVFLTHVFRQTDSSKKYVNSSLMSAHSRSRFLFRAAFIRILGNMRKGVLESRDIDLLKGLSRPLDFSDDIEPVEL